MADTLQVQHTASGATLYALIRDADGAVWNGLAFEAYLTANLSNYDIALTEQGTASRYYTAAMPALAAGRYSVVVFVQAGGAPAETDTVAATGLGEWDGTRFTRLGAPAGVSVSADIAAMKAETAAIVADTNELQTDWANGGRLDLLVDAVKAKTDNLPADPADASDVAAFIAGLDTKLNTIDDFLDTEVAAILAAVDTEVAAVKAKTDNLPEGIQKNTQHVAFPFFMVDSADHVTGKTGLTPTCERSIDGGAFAACTNAAAEVANGLYRITLAAADLNGDFIVLKFTAVGADATVIALKTES
jgi:hypothetical protein